MKKNNLLKNTVLLSIGAILNKGLVFLMIPFFSSWLSTEDYGTFDLITTYITLLIPIIGLSLTESLFRFSLDTNNKNEKKDYTSTSFAIFTFNLIVATIICSILYIFRIWNLALYCCFLLIGEVYLTYFNGYLRSIKKLNFYSFTNIISTIFIAIFTTIFIKVANMSLEGIILGYALGYLFGNIITIIYTKFWKQISFKNVKLSVAIKMFKYSYILIPNSISWWVINVSDRTIINMFLGASFNGIYAIASKVPNFCTSLFSVFNISWQESAIENINSEDKNNYFNNVYNKMFLTLVSLCCCVLGIQFILFNYIFDFRYFDAHLYVPILITSTIFSTMSIFFGGIQISMKKPKINGVTTIIGAVVNVLLHLLLIKPIGLYAAAISTLISQVIVFILRKYYINKDFKIRIEKRNYLIIVLFIYLNFCAYFCNNLSLKINIINLLIAIICFLYIIRQYVTRILNKILKN